QGGGQLTDRVLDSPYAVVLFDEVEKAHPRIVDLLLQVMDEGRLTDSKGRKASFSETVILLTSNLGAGYLGDPELGDLARKKAMAEVKAHFRPEFLNRLDEIIFFNRLSDENLLKIMDLLLKKECSLAQKRGINLFFDDDVKEWLLARNEHPEWGARPLRRIIQRHVRHNLADILLQKDIGSGTTIRVQATPSGLNFVPDSSS
ncbi:MAG: ATP-dependent Clp protease ATP-binding subunit, partial [Anaerolineae bacterium]|nr:ATP-dependent Clp protease ATP-binding subunit [Anaerolineae bacterium]